jgi:virginiamycin A acetyltransferase
MGCECMQNNILYRLYGMGNSKVKQLVLKLATKLEGGEFYSTTLRDIYRDYHKVDIGMYSYGGCFGLGNIDPYTTIGRYCSTAAAIRVFNRNHPLAFKGMHAFFYNRKLGFTNKDQIEYQHLNIENDVWIGYGTIILPSVATIANGAVIGAGSVVTKDVSPYSVVAGNPAEVVRCRFPDHIIEKLQAERWWEKSIE